MSRCLVVFALALLTACSADDPAPADAGSADSGPGGGRDAGDCACNPDFDGDGIVGMSDNGELMRCMVSAIGCDGTDLNCDGVLNRCDFDILRCSFNLAPDPACCATECGACVFDGAMCEMASPGSCADELMGSYMGTGSTCP